MNSSIFYSILMLFAGLGIPIMATLNSGLGARLQSPALAVAILLFVALTLAISILLIRDGIPSSVYLPNTPWYFYFGGVFFVLYILSITWVAPHFGIANAVSFVLLGQLLAMIIIDHFGLMGTPQYSLDMKRLIGIVLMTMGVFMVVSRKS